MCTLLSESAPQLSIGPATTLVAHLYRPLSQMPYFAAASSSCQMLDDSPHRGVNRNEEPGVLEILAESTRICAVSNPGTLRCLAWGARPLLVPHSVARFVLSVNKLAGSTRICVVSNPDESRCPTRRRSPPLVPRSDERDSIQRIESNPPTITLF